MEKQCHFVAVVEKETSRVGTACVQAATSCAAGYGANGTNTSRKAYGLPNFHAGKIIFLITIPIHIGLRSMCPAHKEMR